MDSAGSDRPQRRTALVRRELGRYGIEIAALSETRFAEIGEIKEVGAGYTFFSSGRKYACETLTVYQRHAKKFNHFHLSCMRKLLKIRWQDKIPDTEVLKKANMQSVHILL